MGDDGRAEDVDAPERIRPRGAARRRGDDHPRAVPVADVVLYTAQGCGLCERAKEQLARLAVAHEEVDITGVPELEERYREWLPVVEIDGERAFVYYVDEAALLRRVQPSG